MSGVPGLIVSAPASGTGKTTVTLGLMAAFRAAGLRVAPFKCGPDFIDPAFHAAACGQPSLNLDSWAMAGCDILGRIAEAEGDLILAEGAMGLFDGVTARGAAGSGASADIAALTGWPVVLVLDAAGQAQSAGAVAAGFARFRAGVQVAGVILNRVASPRHAAMLRAGLEEAGIPCLGALPRRADLALPERHLGLVQASETDGLAHLLSSLGTLIAQGCDLAAIRAAARPGPAMRPPRRLPPPGMRVAIARDAAFSFAYPHLLADWHAQGATILPFSPLGDQGPDDSADTCWLPGGYPELHAGRLAAAGNFQAGLRAFAATRPVHGECGGYMAMGAALIDKDGTHHPMAGLLGLVTSYAARRMNLGYRRAHLLSAVPGLPAGTTLAGHEFHYSTILAQPDPPLARITDAAGAPVAETGSHRGHASGTFFHLIGPGTP
ncbi:MAG: cobyrinate a,c-diamide synthase [Gemmobacter sp.]